MSQPGHAVVPASGSVELWADNVARALSANHEITIYASRPPRPVTVPSGPIEYELVPHGSARRATRVARGAWRALGPKRPFFASVLHPLDYWVRVGRHASHVGTEIVHVFNHSQALPVLRRLTDAKLVLHMHCEWLTQLDRRMIDHRLRHADLIVGCSDYITDLIRDRFPHHADRCVTIYNGVDVDALRALGNSRHRTGDVRLLNVGRVSPEKGLHVLVDALELLGEQLHAVQLTIVGEESPVPYEFAVRLTDDHVVRDLGRFYGSSYLQQLKARMSSRVAKRITFVDRVPHGDVLRFYAAADVFVYPSLFESFAIPPVEAMGAGVPVVASNVGGMRETIVDGATGLLVGRDDPEALAAGLRRLIENVALRWELGDAGKERVAALFSWQSIVDATEAAYARLAR